MRKSKLEIGESDEVAVRMVFDHDGEKIVEKLSLIHISSYSALWTERKIIILLS